MTYYIIEKMECVGDILVSTELGYTISNSDTLQINASGYNDFNQWLITNEQNRKDGIVELCDSMLLPCYCVRSSTTNISHTGLSAININDLEEL